MFPRPACAADEDLLPPAKITETQEVNSHDIDKRRTMLRWHQGLGIATLGLMSATAVVGQLNYNDVINGKGTDKYQTAHKALAIAAGTTFFTGALLGYLAPTPFKRDKKADAAMVHKVTMTLTALALAGQIALGVLARDGRGTTDEEKYADAHLVLGYTTLGLTLTGATVWLF